MESKRYYYIITVQYLGFRFSGWQKQPGQKTIESMLQKTLKYILPQVTFKILGAGRTDAKVSAVDAKFELFLTDYDIIDIPEFLELFNTNLPPDIRVRNCTATNSKFNIIQNAKNKEYCYYFAYGKKSHPFSAPFIMTVLTDLNILAMQEAAKLFVGEHCFRAYTVKHKESSNYIREIKACSIVDNTELTANFFPKQSYVLKIKGKGFIRYQIRMIMGALIQVGQGILTPEEIAASLKEGYPNVMTNIASGSGLILNNLNFE